MTKSPQHLAALPDRDEVTPVVRLLTHHIDALEKELAAARVERDQAFARGLELLLDSQESGSSSPADPVSTHAVEAEPFDPSEFLSLDVLLGIDGSRQINLASPREWEGRTGRSESHPPVRDQVSPGAVPSPSGTETRSNASFIAAARQAAQAAAAQTASNAALHPALRIQRSLSERRPILFGLAAILLTTGALQIGIHHFSASRAPAAAPRNEPNVAATTPPAPAPQRLAAEPAATPIEEALPRTTAAIPAEAAWQQALVAPPQRFAEVAAREIEAASLKKATPPSDAAAIYELASRAAEGRGMTRDLVLAARLFENAAAQGLVPAQYRVGKLYEKGLGVSRDAITAKSWYQQAADNGNALAMHQLGVLIAEGAGGKPDYGTAIAWFRRAAQHGVRDSQFNLAVLLARGLGSAQDLSGSYTWFAIAAAHGDEEAAKKRDEVGARLSPTKLSAAKLAAERWRPETPEKFANEVQPSQGWSEAPPPKRTASAGRV
jgi:localization factor PodJL